VSMREHRSIFAMPASRVIAVAALIAALGLSSLSVFAEAASRPLRRGLATASTEHWVRATPNHVTVVPFEDYNSAPPPSYGDLLARDARAFEADLPNIAANEVENVVG